MTKVAARRLIRQRVAQLTPDERRAKSERIADLVLSLPEVADARVVMVFLSLPDEVDTGPLIAGLWKRGKVVAVPHTDLGEGTLVPVRLRPGAGLRRAALDVLEPEVDEVVPVADIDVVVVPGRAFDCEGHRLGRGKGFYDRFLGLKECRALRLAVGYGCQVLEVVPHGPHDVPVDVVVTEDGVLRVSGHRAEE